MIPDSISSPPWHIGLELGASTLRKLDPMPQLTRFLIDIQDLTEHREQLFLILTEMITNAIDYRLLALDPSIRSSPDDFNEFYLRREQALEHLRDGWVKITLAYTPHPSGDELRICVEDSGPGVDYHTHRLALENNLTYSGRGIPLIRTLCRELTYRGRGNCAEVIYSLSPRVSPLFLITDR